MNEIPLTKRLNSKEKTTIKIEVPARPKSVGKTIG
jgi:hypothetical protein